MTAVHWFYVAYLGLALATFGWVGVITYRDKYDAEAWMARTACAVLWPVFWGAVTGCWLYERTCEWKVRRDRRHE